MRQLVLGVFLLGLPLYSLANQRTLTVPDQYPTVQKAIDAAGSGDRVEVKPGLYRESLTFKTGITLTGTDRLKTILMFDTRKAPVLTASNCRGVITKLTFQSAEARPSVGSEYSPLLKLVKSILKVDNCIFQNGYGDGIDIEGQSQCEILRCLIQNNRLNGIGVADKGTSISLHGNRCLQNGWNGVAFARGAAGTATANECRDNLRHGIIVYGKETSAVLKENHCDGNKIDGIAFYYGASGTLEGNLCQNNLYGIAVIGKDSSAVLKNNRCLNNIGCGFCFENESQVRCEGNLCQNNGEINRGYLRNLLVQENFNELEAIAAQLRTKKIRFCSGEWQLAYYYSCLANHWGKYQPSKEAWVIQVLEKWRKAKPNSLTPVIVQGEMYCDLAWQARTGKQASEVSEEGWKGFKENLHKAWAILSAVENNKIDDPMFYYTALTVRVLGMGKVEEMDVLFKKGIAVEPTFYPLYYRKQYILLPRWYGRPGQAEAFMDQAVKDNFKTEGDSLYARMATALVTIIDEKGVKELRFNYKHIKRGHEDLLRRYPNANRFLNSFGLFARMYGDWEQGRILVDRIGNNWDASIWDDQKSFQEFRQWVTTQPEPITPFTPPKQPQKPGI